MDSQLKNRILGVVVLTAIAVICLPLLLDGNQQDHDRMLLRKPPRPLVELTQADPEQMEAEMQTIKAESAEQLPQAVPESAPPKDSSLDPGGIPVSWSLQVASFEDTAKALRLRDDLRGKGFRSYVLSVPTESGVRARVLVGPIMQRERLQALQAEIHEQFKLDGHIVRYNIDDDAHLVGG